MDGSNHIRHSKAMPDMQQVNRRLPRLEVARGLRDKPNLQALVTSPGWREMSLSARVIATTLLALARMDANNSVTIDRKGLSYLTGITDPCTLAKANREVQAIGLFQIDRGYRTKYSARPTVYRLTWWSQIFQRWLSAGYVIAETATSHLPPAPPPPPPHQGTSTSGGLCLPAVPVATAPVETSNFQPTAKAV